VYEKNMAVGVCCASASARVQMAAPSGRSSVGSVVAKPMMMGQRTQVARPSVLVCADGGSRMKVSEVEDNDLANYRKTGFLDSDSAGQSNVFAIEPKVYTTEDREATAISKILPIFAAIVFVGVGAVAVAVLNQEPTEAQKDRAEVAKEMAVSRQRSTNGIAIKMAPPV